VQVRIRRISLISLAQHGCLLGAIAAALPGLLCALLGLGVANLVRRWLESWQSMSISLLGREVARLDLVHVLGLEKLLHQLQHLGSIALPVVFLTVLAVALVFGVLLTAMLMMAGVAYNLLAKATGGLVVQAQTAKDDKSTQQFSTWLRCAPCRSRRIAKSGGRGLDLRP